VQLRRKENKGGDEKTQKKAGEQKGTVKGVPGGRERESKRAETKAAAEQQQQQQQQHHHNCSGPDTTQEMLSDVQLSRSDEASDASDDAPLR
jgi:hypothetical protein